eukprot:4168684-Alexandrium_andersonii.AAC.1
MSPLLLMGEGRARSQRCSEPFPRVIRLLVVLGVSSPRAPSMSVPPSLLLEKLTWLLSILCTCPCQGTFM